MPADKPVIRDHLWQFSDEDGHTISFVDKLLGLELLVYLWETDAPLPISIVVPPEHVGSLVQSLMRFGTSGDLAIARKDANDAHE